MSKIFHRQNDGGIAYCENSIRKLNERDNNDTHFIVNSEKCFEGVLCDECWFTYYPIAKYTG
jgi:hypothetical protein